MHNPKLWKIIGCQMQKKPSHQSTDQNQKSCPSFSPAIHTKQFEIQEQKQSPTGFLNPLNISQIHEHDNNLSFTSFGNRKCIDKGEEELDDVYFGTFGNADDKRNGEQHKEEASLGQPNGGDRLRLLCRCMLGEVSLKVNQMRIYLGSFNQYYKGQIQKIKNIYDQQLKQLHKLYQYQFFQLNKQKTSYFQKVTKLQNAYNQNLQMEKVLKQREAQFNKQISNNKEIIQILMDKIQVMKLQKQQHMIQNNEISQKLFQAQQKIIQMSIFQKQQQRPVNMIKPTSAKAGLRLKTQPQYLQPLTALPPQIPINFQSKSLKQITIIPNCNKNKISLVEKDKEKYYRSNINININNSSNSSHGNTNNNHYYSDFGERDYQSEINRKFYPNMMTNAGQQSTFDFTSQSRHQDWKKRISSHEISNITNNYSTINKKQELQKLLKQQTSLQKKHELKETSKLWSYNVKSPKKPELQPYKVQLKPPALEPSDTKATLKNKRNKNSSIVNNSTSSNPYTDKNYDQYQYPYQCQDRDRDRERQRERYSFGDKKSEKIALIGEKLNKMRTQIYHQLRSMREIQSEN